MSLNIIGNCYGCNETVFPDELHGHVIPYGSEWEELFHEECMPSQFFVEEEDVYGLDA